MILRTPRLSSALLAAMLATVPVGLYIWKRYYNNNEQASDDGSSERLQQVEGGWFQHGTVLAGTILAIMAVSAALLAGPTLTHSGYLTSSS